MSSIHLTLKFLGDVTPNKLDRVLAAAEKAIGRETVFSLAGVELGCFPNFKQPRVIWVGVGGDTAQLYQLQAAVERHVAPLGYPSEKRFRPHLTIGRVKTTDKAQKQQIGQIVEAHNTLQIAEWGCQSVTVMESILKPSGAEYHPIAVFELS